MPQPLPQETRRAPVRQSSFDAATRTFSATVATATPVDRVDYQGPYREILSLKPGAVRLGFLASGRAPLLDSHTGYSVRSQLGVITGARIEGGALVADIKLSDRGDLAPIADDIAAGVIRNVSIGYRVHGRQAAAGPDGVRTITQTDWEPLEVSLVTLPADPQSQIRGRKEIAMAKAAKKTTTASREAAQETSADELLTREEPHAIRGAMPVDQDDDDEAEGEAHRISDADRLTRYDLAARHGLPVQAVLDSVANGETLKEFRRSALNAAAKRAAATRISPVSRGSESTLDDPDFLAQAIGGAIYSRMTGRAPEGAASELRGRSLIELGAMALEARGERVSWANRDQLLTRILTTREGGGGMLTVSDLPTLLSLSSNRVLLEAYQAAASPLRTTLGAPRDAPDFRTLTSVRLGEAPALHQVKEGAEVEYGARAEAKQAFAVQTFARIFAVSRQAIINDDLQAFSDTSAAYGRAAAEAEAGALVSLFAANTGDGVTLDDGSPLYSTTRGNKAASGGAIGVTTLSDGRKFLRTAKGVDGTTPISVTPKFLLVSPDKETLAEQVLTTLTPHVVTDVNPFPGKLSLLVEPRFSGNPWYLFAAASEIPTIRYAYLNGHEGPIVEQQQGWTTLGLEFRAVLDFGCGIEDWRGTYLNPGA